MYSFKEKKIHFNALRNPDAAIYDLELLEKEQPKFFQLATFRRNAQRYSDNILYALLDCTTREKIREYRRTRMDEVAKAASPELTETRAEEAKETKDEAEARAEEVEEAKEEAETRAKEAEERAEEAEQRAEEAEEAQEEAEARAEEAEQALEEEKKKEQPKAAPAKSKNTRSTRKSTGTTSSTRKFK